jgi:hypothetical protein
VDADVVTVAAHSIIAYNLNFLFKTYFIKIKINTQKPATKDNLMRTKLTSK